MMLAPPRLFWQRLYRSSSLFTSSKLMCSAYEILHTLSGTLKSTGKDIVVPSWPQKFASHNPCQYRMCNTYLDPKEALWHRNLSGYIYVRTRIAGLCSIITPTSLHSVSAAFSMSLNCSESTAKRKRLLFEDCEGIAFGYRLSTAVIAVESALYGESHVCLHTVCILHWRWACFVETSFVSGIIHHISIYPLVR